MDPMKIITYVAITAVVALVALGGVAFYAGYTAGLGPERSATASESSGGESAALAEIRGLNQRIASLKETLAQRDDTRGDKEEALAQSQAKLARMADELDAAKRELSDAREKIASLEDRLDETKASAPEPAAASAATTGGERRTAAATPAKQDESVLLYDRFQLERETARGFDEVDLRFGLQTVGSKSASLSINGQRISMRVRDGKQIIHKGVTCDLILEDTDQRVQRAQFSLSCKR